MPATEARHPGSTFHAAQVISSSCISMSQNCTEIGFVVEKVFCVHSESIFRRTVFFLVFVNSSRLGRSLAGSLGVPKMTVGAWSKACAVGS